MMPLPILILIFKFASHFVLDKELKRRLLHIIKMIENDHSLVQYVLDFASFNNAHSRKYLLRYWIALPLIYRGRREKARLAGLAAPVAIGISPTTACNLSCKGCYAYNSASHRELEPELLDRILEEFRWMRGLFVLVQGGEPFMYEPLIETVEKHKNLFFVIFSNGTLISKHMAKRLAKAGNVSVLLSIEGNRKMTDARRGKGTYKKVMKAVKILKRHRVSFGFSLMVTRYNWKFVSTLSFLKYIRKLGAMGIWLPIYLPISKGANMDLYITAEERWEYFKRMRTLKSKVNLLLIDFANEADALQGCTGGGRGYFHINALGDVEPCNYVHFSDTTIHDTSLPEALKSPLFKSIRGHQPYTQNALMPCLVDCHTDLYKKIVKDVNPKPTTPYAYDIFSFAYVDLLKNACRFDRISRRGST